jgi:predicted O-methyltransferase YrrM
MQPLGLLRLYNNYYASRQEKFEPGTSEWLIATEAKFGGRVTTKKHNGGDRMNFWWHHYAPWYEKALRPFVSTDEPITLVEVGVFKGSGVAIWSELFPESRIIGLDINLSNIKDNWDNLKHQGAFTNDNLELHEFDQYAENRQHLSQILESDKVDVVIDDGNHENEAIMMTLESFLPFLSKDFVYIIEDNHLVHKKIEEKYPELNVQNYKEITIVRR